jgi:hypothetical protein
MPEALANSKPPSVDQNGGLADRTTPPGPRHEAVVVSDAVGSRPDVIEALLGLCRRGLSVAIIGTQRASDIASRITEFEPGTGALLVAATSDLWCVTIDRSGTWVVQRDPSAAQDDFVGGGR